MDYFSFDVWAPGWATVSLSDGQLELKARVTGAAHNDPIDDTISACVALLKGELQAAVSYFDEPGERRLRIVRADRNLELSVIWFPDGTPFRPTNEWFHDNQTWVWVGDESPWPTCSEVFRATVPMAAFLSSVHSSLNRCYSQLGSEGYRRKWSEDDPRERLLEFERLLEAIS